MRAVGFQTPTPTLSEASFSNFELATPRVQPSDLLVEVHATSINPVDYKQRQKRLPQGSDPVVLGWDASGIVRATGAGVEGFKVGDKVYYAGEIDRQGSNAELQLVDHRLAAHMPRQLDFAAAAALPLTALTAYEALFERLEIPREGAGNVLIIGGAGGVGSLAIQLLRSLTDAEIYATAGREESIAWVQKMGVHHVVDRSVDLLKQRESGKLPEFDYIFSTTGSDTYHAAFPRILKPLGSLCLIDDPKEFDVVPFKMRSQSVHWELMFTKSLFNVDRVTQGDILSHVSGLIDRGELQSTLRRRLTGLRPEVLVEAHALQESGTTIGKTVIEF